MVRTLVNLCLYLYGLSERAAAGPRRAPAPALLLERALPRERAAAPAPQSQEVLEEADEPAARAEPAPAPLLGRAAAAGLAAAAGGACLALALVARRAPGSPSAPCAAQQRAAPSPPRSPPAAAVSQRRPRPRRARSPERRGSERAELDGAWPAPRPRAAEGARGLEDGSPSSAAGSSQHSLQDSVAGAGSGSSAGAGGGRGSAPAAAAAAGAAAPPPDPRVLCEELVVPEGWEVVFVMPEVVTAQRQRTSFDVLSLQGEPISRVFVDEQQPGVDCCMRVEQTDGRPMGVVRTDAVHGRLGGMPQICRPDGSVFGTLSREDSARSSRYALRGEGGQLLLVFKGDFRSRRARVLSPESGQSVCVVEKAAWSALRPPTEGPGPGLRGARCRAAVPGQGVAGNRHERCALRPVGDRQGREQRSGRRVMAPGLG
ncbi:unnamed protein product [Prorocentrum cordatum]|uniref:Uncharacterized protein n=1 Tax=Prorocentrum cordatum TaxID=2364126 RepID=A0ABN9U1R7_9DINO|nr:unnamed protein product [Polarella glacialis]